MVDSKRRAIVKAIGGTVGGLGALTATSGTGSALELEIDVDTDPDVPDAGRLADPLGDDWDPLEGVDLDDESVDQQSQESTSEETVDESAVGEDGDDVVIEPGG